MSTTRSRLKLDEQAFQGLLAAAFTIQEHNDKNRRSLSNSTDPDLAPKLREFLESHCPQCAASLPEGQTECPQCRSGQFRPGERMQRKFASLWEMSQEQGMRNLPRAQEDTPPKNGAAEPESSAGEKDEIRIIDVQEEPALDVSDWARQFTGEMGTELDLGAEAGSKGEDSAPRSSLKQAISQLLDYPRADLYLGLAIVVAMLALLWPSPTTATRGQLRPWQRILVKMGIAEAPAAAVHYRGNANVQVWVDPHTALYYCPGEDQYGKTTNGRYTDQREAQLEQFEPAGRAACP